MKARAFPVFTLCLLAVSFAASADIIWPAAVLEARLLTWWAIGLGLLLEFAVVRQVFRLPLKRAALATAVANGVSTLAGIVLIPLAGIIWVPLGVLLRFPAVFSPIGWITTFATACLINSAIEAVVYKRSFHLTVRRREFLWVLFANALSVGVASAASSSAPCGGDTTIYPKKLPPGRDQRMRQGFELQEDVRCRPSSAPNSSAWLRGR